MAPTFTSLFSGCGGLDLGFIREGFKPIASFDSDPDAVSAYELNVGPHIHNVDLAMDNKAVNEAARACDLLLAGPPCQGFSTVGPNDPKDARNKLLSRTVEIACAAKTPVVVIENVRGLLSPSFRAYMNSLLRKLEAAGYSVSVNLLNASDYGVPQHRRRVFIVASRLGAADVPLQTLPAITVREALKGLPRASRAEARSLQLSEIDLQIARAIKPGYKLSNVRNGDSSVHTWSIPTVFGKTSKQERAVLEALLLARRTDRKRENGDADPVEARRLARLLGHPVRDILLKLQQKGFVRKVDNGFDLTHSFNGKYRRLQWDEPAPTVDTRFGQPRYFLHPEQQRGFSIRETARIQGFPDDFSFSKCPRTAFRLVGNAVPPPLAAAIARGVRRRMFPE